LKIIAPTTERRTGRTGGGEAFKLSLLGPILLPSHNTHEKATQITNIEITTAMPLFKSSKQKRKDAAAKKFTENTTRKAERRLSLPKHHKEDEHIVVLNHALQREHYDHRCGLWKPVLRMVLRIEE